MTPPRSSETACEARLRWTLPAIEIRFVCELDRGHEPPHQETGQGTPGGAGARQDSPAEWRMRWT